MRGAIDWEAFIALEQRQEAERDTATLNSEVRSAYEFESEILDLYDNGFERGLTIGWPSIDELFTLRHGEFTVLTGVPGHGKSSWLDNVMVRMAQRHDWRWMVFSAENYPVSRHIAGLMEIYTGRPFNDGYHARIPREDARRALHWLGEYFGFIAPKEDGYNLNHIVRLAAMAGELDALVIDPWNELDHSRPRDMREDEFISAGLSKLRWLARTAKIHVFVVAHPAKFIRRDGEKKPIVTLNEVKGASEWYAKADNGISVWRDETDRNAMAEIHVQKIRFREIGRLGMAELQYDRVNGRFNEPYRANQREPGEDDE